MNVDEYRNQLLGARDALGELVNDQSREDMLNELDPLQLVQALTVTAELCTWCAMLAAEQADALGRFATEATTALGGTVAQVAADVPDPFATPAQP